MYPHDPVEDFFEIYGSHTRGYKLRNGDYIYYFTSLVSMKDALNRCEQYNNSAIPLIQNAWFVIKNDNTIIKNRIFIEDMIDMVLPLLIKKDNETLTNTEQKT